MTQDQLLIVSGIMTVFLYVSFADYFFCKWHSRESGYDCAECKMFACPGKRRWQRMKEGRK